MDRLDDSTPKPSRRTCEHSYETLSQLQGLSLRGKITESRMRIAEWVEYWGKENVYVSFSGGKDSTVALDIVRTDYPNIPAVFIDTGLEYPEIVDFVKTVDNVTILRPEMTFKKVLEKYGFPIVSKEQSMAISRYRNTKSEQQRRFRLWGFPNGKKGTISKKWHFLIDAPFKISDACCDVMKKKPLDRYAKETGRVSINGIMASESNNRRRQYLKQGCNAFDLKKPKSSPIIFWSDRDIWEYIKTRNVKYSSIYDIKGITRTGCMFCMFGCHLEKGTENRFQIMKRTHPKIWRYCIYNLGIGKVLDHIGVEYEESKQLNLGLPEE